jgi:hypothetical protein
MSLVSNPHDKLFKQIWSDRETARDFLANYLPDRIRKLIDLNTIEIRKDSFVESNLKEFFSDLLYRVSFGDKAATFTCCSNIKAIRIKSRPFNCSLTCAISGNLK